MDTSDFTVVLLVPDLSTCRVCGYACSDVGYGQDVFVAHVVAEDRRGALDLARRQAFARFEECAEEGGSGINDPLDFGCVVIFSGRAPIVCFGWEL